MKSAKVVLTVLMMLGSMRAASINGVIQNSEGKVLGGVPVYLQPIRNVGVKLLSQQITTDKNGAFGFGEVAKGTYRICIPGGTPGYVDPCVWKLNPVELTVASEIDALKIGVEIPAAVTISVKVSDDLGLLLSHDEVKTSRPPILLGARTADGLFIAMDLASASAKSRTYSKQVPAGTTIGLLIDCEDYQVVDDGAAQSFVSKNHSLATSVTSLGAGSSKELRVKVTGKR